ncbi:ATP-binding protein [Xiamenia xianingshaonis]|uniref:AAA family ATPase n=1 Tax=Xiamenia xianingshaonis TaxID=2682776 RepID=A0A9E6MQJ4_9ACTN|nr:SbcC/MukB-like Walker B domain-containing protein [Xiamenia xianingshaonis]NHM14177.1 AAA family ATPase [Xiamenia xianingshaonis]QTU84208.1 AAA family ATPase [Xiamenia xianingshaonis]
MSASRGHIGQWRLAHMEVVNWGTFCGHHAVEVSPQGLLITGESGSGKSTLLDAIATALTPPGKRQFNAAAKTNGSLRDDRSLVSYLRGAYAHATTASGEIASRFLRDRAAIWSGILLRYDCGIVDGLPIHRPVNLVVLFHLKAGSVNQADVSSLYVVARGTCTLLDLKPFIERGADLAALNRYLGTSGKGHRSFAPYAALFCRFMGIRSTQTLELLHKTQAAKNFGSLDELFRRFMLEKPPTYELSDAAVDQFTSLSDAYAGVVEQRKQMLALEPLEGLAEKLSTAQNNLQKSEHLREQLGPLTLSLEKLSVEAAITALHHQAETAAIQQTEAEAEVRNAEVERERAVALYDKNDGLALAMAEKDATMARLKCADITQRRKHLLHDLRCLEIASLPASQAQFIDLQRRLEKEALEAKKASETASLENTRIAARIEGCKTKTQAIEEELRHLRENPTNIPEKLHRIRHQLADELGLSDHDVPFFGELVSVRPQDEAWQGALERLIGRQALVLLAPKKAGPSVSAWVNGHNLGTRFEYELVPEAIEVPSVKLSEHSSVRKLVVNNAPAHPEFALWANREIRRRFNYECVPCVEDLAKHQYALTQEGLIKRAERHVKDDRYRINDRTRWLLGTSNAQKIDVLAGNLQTCREELEQAQTSYRQAQKQLRTSFDLQRTCEVLREAAWENYDINAATEELEAANRFLETLTKGNAKLAEAARLRDAAIERERTARKAYADAQSALSDIAAKTSKLEDTLASIAEKMPPDWHIDDADRTELTNLLKKANSACLADSAALWQASSDVHNVITRRKDDEAAIVQRTLHAIEAILMSFKRDWPAQAAHFDASIKDLDGYLAILRRIRAVGLPDYENRFLQILSEFSRDRITALNTAIRGAFAEIREKLEPVNRSLALSDYAPGIHLHIELQKNLPVEARDFLSSLRTIVEGSWNIDDVNEAEQRFLSLSQIINRLGSEDPADKRWKDRCLDTRLHVAFVAKELDATGAVCNVHASDAGLSGGEKQKLVIFCLAAALRYQLSDESEEEPSYGTVVLDEAFDKADYHFTKMAMSIFETFGFHMILATPEKWLKTLEHYVGAFALVRKDDGRRSNVDYLEFKDAPKPLAKSEQSATTRTGENSR